MWQLICESHKSRVGACEMVQWIEALVVKAVDLNLIPGTRVVETENPLSQVLFWFLHVCFCACVCLCVRA